MNFQVYSVLNKLQPILMQVKTGVLHLGHAAMLALQDIMIRPQIKTPIMMAIILLPLLVIIMTTPRPVEAVITP